MTDDVDIWAEEDVGIDDAVGEQDLQYSVDVALEDLVLLQMTGRMDAYLEELDGEPDKVIETARDEAVSSGVFGNILDNTVESQFSDRYAFLRELAQNGKDAYGRDTERVVRFETPSPGEPALTARDYGSGMDAEGVIKNMLVPFNSAKHLDMETIGEHGIGWYSVLDPAEAVEVTTGTGEERIEASIKQRDGEWRASIDIHDGAYEGTEVRLEPERRLDDEAIYDRLRKHVGHVDPATATITVDGEAVNTEREAYELVGTGEVRNDGRTDVVELYRKDEYDGTALKTQDGLYIDEDHRPFGFGGLHAEIFADMTDAGYGFWFELPDNVGLTKGRDAVVSGDRWRVRQGMEDALEDVVLGKVLEEEYSADKLDMKVSDWVDDIMEESYKGKTRSAILGDGLITAATGLVYLGSQKVKEEVKQFRSSGIDMLKASGPNIEAYDRNKDREDRAAMYLDEMDEFSERIFQKDFIPATEYDGEREIDRTVSIQEMVAAHVEDELYIGEDGDREGLWIPPDNEPARRVREKLQQMDEQATVDPDDDTSLRSSLGDLYRSVTALVPAIDVDLGAPAMLERTNTYTVERTVEEEGVGQAYLNLLEAAGQIDAAVSEANDLGESPVHLHYDEESFAGMGMEKAHQAGVGISFNLASRDVEEHVEDLRSGEMTEETYMQLLDTVLHEKAHYARGRSRGTADHGLEFYEEDKRELREHFLEEQYEASDELYEEINAELEAADAGEAVDPETFGDLVDRHASYLDPIRAMLE